jgi:hypothetical protein
VKTCLLNVLGSIDTAGMEHLSSIGNANKDFIDDVLWTGQGKSPHNFRRVLS